MSKTHLANSLGQLACIKGYNVRFTLAADLVNELVASSQRNTLGRRLNAWTRPDLVIIDELGYLSFDARGADLLYQAFNRRYQRAATIVTTNLPFKDWGSLFHNAAAASAIADRLVHKGTVVSIKGKSRRSDREVDLPCDPARSSQEEARLGVGSSSRAQTGFFVFARKTITRSAIETQRFCVIPYILTGLATSTALNMVLVPPLLATGGATTEPTAEEERATG